MKAIELIILLAVIILATIVFGLWGFVGGIVVAILFATGKMKSGLEDNKKGIKK